MPKDPRDKAAAQQTRALAEIDQARAGLRDWYAALDAPTRRALINDLGTRCCNPACPHSLQALPPHVLECVLILAVTQLLALAAGEG